MRKPLLLAVCFGLVALLAGRVGAQPLMGLFYQEAEKDGRVYVFNSPERFKSWQASGEIGTAITLVGRAEGGMTLVGENETAIDLYLFKHSLPGYERPTPKPYAPPFNVSWKDGVTTIESKNATLNLNNRMQIRFTSEDLDPASSSQPERDSFRVRRMETKMSGWVYTKDLTYELELNWADTANVVNDANFQWDLTHGKKNLMVKAGQFKVPFGRQELSSSTVQEFVDRSIVAGEFERGRDIGLQLWGTPFGGKLDWRVGVFNGNGRTVTRNDNDDLQLNARVTWQPFGDAKYSEGDFESTDRPLLAIAAQYENNTLPIAAAGGVAAHARERTITGGDIVFKYRGLFLFGELFDATNDRTNNLVSFDNSGYNLQAGYFVIPKRLELALRYAVLDPNADRDNDERTETGLAVGYFFNKHPHKLQADYREIENKASKQKDRELRLQYQIMF